MLTQAPKGTQDMLPQAAHRWQRIEKNMRDICALAGYREIRTPIVEHTELFQRGAHVRRHAALQAVLRLLSLLPL